MGTYSISVVEQQGARIKLSGGFVLTRVVASVHSGHEGDLAIYTYDNSPTAGIDPPSGITPLNTSTPSSALVKVGDSVGASIASMIARFWLQPGTHDVALPAEGVVIPSSVGVYISARDVRYMNIYWSEPEE